MTINFSALQDDWLVLCTSGELKQRPQAFQLLGQDLVVYRDPHGQVHAFLDRCPHRNVRLSEGRLCDGLLVCQYHGWEFDTQGRCVKIPGRLAEHDTRAPGLKKIALQETAGLVFACLGDPGDKPPFLPAVVNDPQYGCDAHANHVAADAKNIVENFLDPFHTHFVHAGLIRNRSEVQRSLNQIKRRHMPRGFEIEYLTTERQTGVLARFAPPIDQAFGRFRLPGIVELDYRTAGVVQFVNCMYITPRTQSSSSLYFRVFLRRGGLPPRFVFLVAGAIAKRALKQDQLILEKQTRRALELGGEFYCNTELDLARRQLDYLYDGSAQQVEFHDLQALI
ncbi:MAG: aromatic ring-hydroxylating dioxygenase subunit alpha [Candidatus Sericytochromatia bacterium]|nr:aromatic ring-hydroxylating dioxygenase subunit alpha [Candidatus Sericytochromatia bacterium]